MKWIASMFGAKQIEGAGKKDRKKLAGGGGGGGGGGGTGCGPLQSIVVVLSLTTLLLFFLLVYVISVDETTNFAHPFARVDAWRADRVPGVAPAASARAEPDRRSPALEPEVQKLVDALAASARAANGGTDPEWSEEESRDWKARNPCRSRDEMLPLYARRSRVAHVVENAQWSAVVREYAKLHRTCLRSAGDLRRAFAGRNSSTPGCKFLIADVMEGTGLGNKVLVVASNVLYAILTQRVVLVPLPTLLPLIMCEPFEGSAWGVDNATLPYYPPLSHSKRWQFPEYFYRDFDRGKEVHPHASAVTFVSNKIKDQWHPRERFYCSSDQARYRDIPWLYVTGCLYTLPNLFAVGAFRPVLEALFPDKMALTHLLRSVMLPGDEIWGRATRIHDAYLARADELVGIQVRYKDGLPHYTSMNEVYNARITQCAVDNGILPNMNFSEAAGREPPAGGKVVVVFIACLYTGLRDHLTRLFLRHPAGENVAVVQVTHEDAQEFGVEVDRQALAEVLALSFSDHLFVTPISTYGGLAQAYGALVPWFIEIRRKAPQPCTRGRTVDICYQGGARRFDCPHDPDVNGKFIADVVPYLVPCLYEDYPKGGVQLITDD